MVDTLGLILGIVVTGAEVSDRAGALAVLPPVLRGQPLVEQLWADAGYAGGTLAEQLRAQAAHPGLRPGQLAAFLEGTAEAQSCPEGVYNPVPLITSVDYSATCSGGARNGFYGAGVVNAYNAVQ